MLQLYWIIKWYIYLYAWFFFNSIITFSYTKYFVHSFTIDVVFTLSYLKTKEILSDIILPK